MGNVSLKRVVCDTIAQYIATNIPSLAGKVSAVAAGPETTEGCLSVKVLPEMISFEAAEAQEVWQSTLTSTGPVVCDVGQFTGIISIQLLATSITERETYEQQILDLFLNSTWSPGTLYLNTPNLIVNGIFTLYSADFKLFLETETWNEELAFEAKRFSFLQVYIDYPALVAFNAADIAISICQAGMEDVVVTANDTLDQITINDDGTISKGSV